MKKIQNLLVITFAILFFNIANALEIVDVRSDYWAGQEIIRAIQNGYIYVIDSNKFKPEGTMTRSEFVTALLKVISKQDESVKNLPTFKDINNTTPNKKSIMLSEQIKLAFGYPDNTFKPNKNINHNETMSLIANITNNDFKASDITSFDDYDEIPIWARRAYIKNVANGLYVNHPDGDKFTPNNNLTRAEAAVLFDKIAANLNKIKDSYRNLSHSGIDDIDDAYSDDNGNLYDFDKSKFITDNTLGLVPFATNNKVKVYNNKLIIEAGNILVGTNLKLVYTRTDLVGHHYAFVAPNDVYTKEGTFVYPKGTEFYAYANSIGYSAWRSKPEKSNIVFYKYTLPGGQSYDMAGVPFTKKDKVVYKNSLQANCTKALTYKNTSSKQGLINVAHQMSPLTEFDIKTGKTIYILITGDKVFPLDETYQNFRTEPSLIEDVKI